MFLILNPLHSLFLIILNIFLKYILVFNLVIICKFINFAIYLRVAIN